MCRWGRTVTTVKPCDFVAHDFIIHWDRHLKLASKGASFALSKPSFLSLESLCILLFSNLVSAPPPCSIPLPRFFTFPDLWHVVILASALVTELEELQWRPWTQKHAVWCVKGGGQQILQPSELLYATTAVSKPPRPLFFSVALPPPQSTQTPALATRIISSGGKSFPLVSYCSFLHQLMMSQSIHKFVIVCRFENFDTAAGCTGWKSSADRPLKWSSRGEGTLIGAKKQTRSA